jgi:hypothetical protein
VRRGRGESHCNGVDCLLLENSDVRIRWSAHPAFGRHCVSIGSDTFADRNAVLYKGVRICYLPHTHPSGSTPTLRATPNLSLALDEDGGHPRCNRAAKVAPEDPLRDERREPGTRRRIGDLRG